MGTVIYLDGHSVREQRLICDMQESALALSGENTPVIWDYSDINIEKEYDGASGLAVLSNKIYPEARLMIDSEILYCEIIAKLKRQHAFIIPLTVKSLSALLIISLLVLAGGYLFIRYESKIIAPRIPQKIQIALVDIIAEGMKEDTPSVCRTQQKAALSKIARKIAKENKIGDVRVLIDADPQINAFALPARTIVFNQGMLSEVKNEDEIAGIFAHEMGHIRKFHPQQRFLGSVGISLLAALTIGTSDIGSLSKIAVMFDDITYSKKMENEADDEAISIMRKSGINPAGLTELFKRIEKKEGKHTSPGLMLGEYLSTHPSTASRIVKFGKLKKGMHAPYLDAVEWKALTQNCSTAVSKQKKKN